MTSTKTETISASLTCTEQIDVENGWRQLEFNCSAEINLQPNSLLQIDSIRLPILWQISKHNFLVVLAPQDSLKKQTHWSNFSIISTPINAQVAAESRCILECHGDGLFAAIHQIYNWRLLQKPLHNIILVADAVPQPAFKLQPSRIYSSLFPAEVTASLGLLDDWQVCARFANKNWQPGCFLGGVEELIETVQLKLKGHSICNLKY